MKNETENYRHRKRLARLSSERNEGKKILAHCRIGSLERIVQVERTVKGGN